MQRLFLLDAYALIYRAYYALIRSPRINSRGENTSAVMGFVNTLDELLRKEHPDFIAVAFDPAGKTFRHERYPGYKAQREATPEDIRFAVPFIKDIIRAYNIALLEVAGYEADDVIGTAAKLASEEGVEVCMVTPDKDYAQLVTDKVCVCKPGHGAAGMERLGVTEVCEKYGIERPEQFIDMLGLMGDTADNFAGCPGVGEKTAAKLIGEFGSIDNLLANTDKIKGAMRTKVEEHREDILLSRFLATIRRDVPMDFDLESLRRREPDYNALRSIFERLEFRSLIERIVKSATPSPPTPQASLFDLETPASKKKVASPMPNTTPQLSLFDAEQAEGGNLFSEPTLMTLEDGEYDYKLLEKEEDIRDFCLKLLTEEEVCFDTETSNIDALSAKLVGISFSTAPHSATYIAVPHDTEGAQRVVELLRPFFENEHIRKVGQNLKYDIQVLLSYGVEVRGELFDTMLAHYLIQPELRHNMDYLAEIYLGYRSIHIEELIGAKGKGQKSMADLAPKDVYKYACEDADITLQLKAHLEKGMAEGGVERVFRKIEMPLLPVLVRMERHGVRLDTAALAETGSLFSERMAALENEIFELAGHPFSITSPRQVGEVLFDELKLSAKAKKTSKGQYSTSEEVLEGLRTKHPIVDKILAHRGLKKLLSTYVEALPRLIRPETQHIHTSFNQAVTSTGRLSSSNPNLQNIPVRGDDGREIRKAFVAEEGCRFFSADYSQIELRIMAHLSGDAQMIEAFRAGEDIHAATAAKIYKKSISEVTRDERRKAKTANFGIIYGISAFGLAERMEVSRSEARELIDSYFATYPQIKEYMERSVKLARERGYISTEFGRRRYLPDINSRNAVVRGYAERNAVNAPIQGTAADIIKIAMVRIDRRFREEKIASKMLLQVHDELNFSVFPEEEERVRAIVIEEMQNAFSMRVPLVADCGIGNNWLEAH